MKQVLFLLVLFIFGCQQNTQKKQEKYTPIFIYDYNELFKCHKTSNDTLNLIFYETYKKNYRYYIDSIDTFLIATDYKYYMLYHYLKYPGYKDTSFVKPKSFLDSISYFDDKWLQSEEHLDSIWEPIKNCWRCSGIYDTAKIYLILPIKNKDSVIVKQVHRFLYQSL